MSGLIGQEAALSSAYGIGQVVEAPTLEEATEKARAALGLADGAFYACAKASDPEVKAHRAQHFSTLAGELAQAAYLLQRAAYLKATK